MGKSAAIVYQGQGQASDWLRRGRTKGLVENLLNGVAERRYWLPRVPSSGNLTRGESPEMYSDEVNSSDEDGGSKSTDGEADHTTLDGPETPSASSSATSVVASQASKPPGNLLNDPKGPGYGRNSKKAQMDSFLVSQQLGMEKFVAALDTMQKPESPEDDFAPMLTIRLENLPPAERSRAKARLQICLSECESAYLQKAAGLAEGSDCGFAATSGIMFDPMTGLSYTEM